MSVMPMRFRPWLTRSEWFKERRTPVDPRVPSDHPAHALLSELGGVSFVDRKRQINLLEFEYVENAAEEAQAWSSTYGLRLVGVAEHDNSHAEAHMTERGHLIGFSLIHEACWFLGKNLEEAMGALWDGERSRPMLLRGQETVSIYGEEITKDDPRMILPGSELLL